MIFGDDQQYELAVCSVLHVEIEHRNTRTHSHTLPPSHTPAPSHTHTHTTPPSLPPTLPHTHTHTHTLTSSLLQSPHRPLTNPRHPV